MNIKSPWTIMIRVEDKNTKVYNDTDRQWTNLDQTPNLSLWFRWAKQLGKETVTYNRDWQIDRMTGGWIDGQIWKQNMKTNIFLHVAMQIVLKQEKDINALLNKYCFLYMRWKLLLIILQQEWQENG